MVDVDLSVPLRLEGDQPETSAADTAPAGGDVTVLNTVTFTTVTPGGRPGIAGVVAIGSVMYE